MTDNNQQNGFYENNENPNNQNFGYAPQQSVEEKASVGFAILSFLIPLAGLIIFLVHKDKRPKTAKTSGICALVSFILNIVITIIIYASMFAGVGAAVDSMADDFDDDTDSSYSQDISADDGTQSEDGNVVDGNTLGDYGCVVKSATVCKDWMDEDAVLITYEFTNNSSDSISFDVALDAKAFQDGVGLETAILDDETDYLDVEIKPGVTKEVKKAYVLRDTSTDVEIEISELISLSDDKIVTTVELPK